MAASPGWLDRRASYARPLLLVQGAACAWRELRGSPLSQYPAPHCLQFGLFHGDPHPGNIFAMADGRIAYVDFGNVAELSQANKQTLIDAVVHAVNEDYEEMARDFIKLVSVVGCDIKAAACLQCCLCEACLWARRWTGQGLAPVQQVTWLCTIRASCLAWELEGGRHLFEAETHCYAGIFMASAIQCACPGQRVHTLLR